MNDRELYRLTLGIQAPWEVPEVQVELPVTGVTIHFPYIKLLNKSLLEHVLALNLETADSVLVCKIKI